MSNQFGAQSMIAPLKQVLVKRPDSAFGQADPLTWHYARQPNLEKAQQQHDQLTGHLQKAGVEVIFHDTEQPGRADAVFVFDPAIVTDRGAIVLRMGKTQRRGEEAAMADKFHALGIPIIHTMIEPSLAEGGDLLWIDEKTLAVGIGFRTNRAGFQQLHQVLAPQGVTVIPVELPYFTGPEACLHLLTMISIVDEKLAVVYLPLMSVPFYEGLLARGFKLIEVDDAEFETMATNILAIRPGEVIMIAGNDRTRARLEDAGCFVHTYDGGDISLITEGGPTCLTRPLWRSY